MINKHQNFNNPINHKLTNLFNDLYIYNFIFFLYALSYELNLYLFFMFELSFLNHSFTSMIGHKLILISFPTIHTLKSFSLLIETHLLLKMDYKIHSLTFINPCNKFTSQSVVKGSFYMHYCLVNLKQ